MSKKSESKLPGELNENWGSNYMMDGFFHDMEYGHGNKDSIGKDPTPQPSTSGMAQLPDGLLLALHDEEDDEEIQHQDDEGAMDLEGMGIVAKVDPDVDRTDAGVVDHTWLSNAFQDPLRLPTQPVDNGIPMLQEAWGDRTDGIQRVDLYDRSAIDYEDAMQHEEDDDPLQRDKLASLIRMAMRRSAAGHSFSALKEELLQAAGPKLASKLARPLKAIEQEHGLSGNVYVRASAYPRLQHGKWNKALSKAAKGCRYLVASSTEEGKSCAESLGLQLVASPNEIPWKKELSRYGKLLSTTRKQPKRASESNPREYLRRWFLQASQSPRLDIESTKIRPTMPVDTVTAAEAKKALAEFTVPHRVVLDMQERHDKKESEKAVKRVASMVKARLLSPEEAQGLLTSKAPPKSILKAAAKLALTTKTAKYQGPTPVHNGKEITREEAWAELRTAELKWKAEHKEVQERVAKDQVRQKVRLIEAQINGGMQGKKLAAFIRDTLNAQEALRAAPLLNPILKKTGALNPKKAKAQKYRDAKFTRHVASAPELSVSDKEIRKAARWVRQQMSEGVAGPDLDNLIQLRIGRKVASAASSELNALRKEHEGVAGHLYVEAAAYASPEGVAGCEEGALKHRANQLKFVKSMPRCGSCVYRNADSVCQKYNKPLLESLDPAMKEELQRQALDSHRMSDQEATAAMFEVGTQAMAQANEFGLHNAALDNVDAESLQHEMLDGIFFGGFEV